MGETLSLVNIPNELSYQSICRLFSADEISAAMSIRINVPSTRCRAGTTIAGSVSLHGDIDIDVETITISLLARCKTKITRNSGQSSVTNRGRATLYYERRTLFKGPHTLHSAHEWDFELTLPARCTGRSQDRFTEEYRRYNQDPQQELPPSFQSINHSFGWSADSFIKYELEAHLSRCKTFAIDMKANKLLSFVTTRDIERPDPQLKRVPRLLSCSSQILQTGREDSALTFKDRLEGIFSRNIPCARFTISLRIPRVAVLEQHLPMFLELDHDIEGSSCASPPLVRLKMISVELRQMTDVQCIREEILREGNEFRSWEDSVVLSACDFSQRMQEAPIVTERMDLGTMLQTRIRGYQSPTFSTFNIRRTYGFVVKLTLECAQKNLKAEYRSGDVTVLAAEFMPSEGFPSSSTQMPEPLDREAIAPAYSANPAEGTLPSYEDVKVR